MFEVNKKNFETEVLGTGKPVIVDVWGPSCQSCLKLMPDVEELSSAYENKIKIVKLNSAENRRLCVDYQVMGLPAFLAFKDGEEIKRISGSEVTKQDIEQLISEMA